MKKLSLSIFALAAIMLTSCNDKDENTSGPSTSGEPVLATFRISSPDTYVVTGTDPGSATENQIDIVEFYLFDENGVRDESTSSYDYSYHKYEGSVNQEIMFLVKSGNNKKILVAANRNLGQQAGLNYDEMEALVEAKTLTNTNSRQINAGEFVMSGKATASIVENRTDNEVTIRIHRTVSKVEQPRFGENFSVNIPQDDLWSLFEDSTVTNEAVVFTLDSYALINGYSKSHTFMHYNSTNNEQSEWNLWAPGGEYFASDYDTDGNLLTAYSGMIDNSPWLTGTSIFVYENQPRDTVSTETGIAGFPREEVYAFLIKGTLSYPAANETYERYWRVNLIRDDNYRIFRNTIYRVLLDELRTIGYGNPKEGDDDEDNGGGVVPRNDQTGIQATIEIVPWTIRTQNTDF